MEFKEIVETAPGVYYGKFVRTPEFPGGRAMWRLELRAECDEPTLSFLPFVDDCEIKKVLDFPRGIGWRDEDPTPDTHYKFAVDLLGVRDEGEGCQLRQYQWRMFIQTTPLSPFDFEAGGGIDLLGVSLHGALKSIPDKSGVFFVRVCCREGDGDGCAPTYTLIAESGA